MATTSNEDGKPSLRPATHIFVFPFASPSHIVPLLELTHRLLSFSQGRLIATVLLTPNTLPLAQSLLSSHPTQYLRTLVLSPRSPPPRQSVRGLPALIHSLLSLHDPIVSWFRSHPDPPTAIISDFFLGWTHHLARELHVPRVVFCPSGALGTAIYYSLWLDQPKNPKPDKDPNHPVRFDRILNSPVFSWWQLSHVYTTREEGDPVEAEFFRDSMVANMSSWATVFNSFADLESAYLDHLKKELGHDRVWAVGPLLPPEEEKEKGGESEANRDAAGSRSRSAGPEGAMRWLDQQADSSVVYICFGSRTALDAEQAAALRRAIQQSKVARFLWCVGQSDGADFTDGEVDRDRVMVVKGWAPQLEILRHRAVGAFLTHCGWNSVLEAAATGVEMMAWPIGADQFADARLVVEAGVATQVGCSGPENVPDSDELARLLDDSVGGGGENPRKEKVRRLKEAAVEAVKIGGSSHRDLVELMSSLEELRS